MNCFRTRPTWMNEEREVIGNVPLSTIMLPGTHNAGAFDTDDSVKRFLIATPRNISLKCQLIICSEWKLPCQKIHSDPEWRCLDSIDLWHTIFGPQSWIYRGYSWKVLDHAWFCKNESTSQGKNFERNFFCECFTRPHCCSISWQLTVKSV